MSKTNDEPDELEASNHRAWVRVCHWLVVVSFLLLLYTGFEILRCHPRLYWGETGNDLMPALLELPIGIEMEAPVWKDNAQFRQGNRVIISKSRIHTIYNENSWSRSLHFLVGWVLVFAGLVYLLRGIISGHFRNNFLPRIRELAPRKIWREVLDHFRLRIRPATGGPQYGLLQKLAYCVVVFIAIPLVVLTGVAMSPAANNAFRFLGNMFGGFQSARTVHFFSVVALVLFLLIHVIMVIRSGFKRQIRAMTIGSSE